MAKGKNARALFEVIKQAQQRQEQARRAATSAEPASPVVRATPVARAQRPGGGWMKLFRRGAATAAEVDPTTAPAPRLPVMRSIATAPVEPEAETTGPAADAGATAIQPSDADAANELPAAGAALPSEPAPATAVEPADEAAEAPAEPLPVATSPVRPSRAGAREITLTLSYPTLAIAAAAAVMLMVVAFLAGKHLARPVGLTGPSMQQVRNGKAFPDVLNVNGSNGVGANRAAPQAPVDVVSEIETSPAALPGGKPEAVAGRPGASVAAAPPQPAAIGASDSRRVVGRNYVIAQSYPEESAAQKAVDLLQRNNIPASVEQIDASPGWYCVVTRVGFDRGQGADMERYIEQIRSVNAQAARERLKKFEPYGYKWK